MAQKCSVPRCSSVARRNSKISFHNFPSNPEMQLKWLHAIRRDPNIFNIKAKPRVCSKHFTEEQYIFGGTLRKLKKNAVPKVFSWLEENTPPIFVAVIKSNENAATSSKHVMKNHEKSAIIIESNNLKSESEMIKVEQEDVAQDNILLKQLTSPRARFSQNRFADNDKKIMFYTGFQNYQTMMKVYNYALPSHNIEDLFKGNKSAIKSKQHLTQLSAEDQYFLTLIKLRRAFSYETLGHIFSLSKITVEKIFLDWIHFLFLKLGGSQLWPCKDELIGNAPKNMDKIVGSIDCIEFYFETLFAPIKQSQYYSKHKGITTLKSLIMVDPNGVILYMSKLFSGSISYKTMINESDLIGMLKQKVESGDTISADKGFNVSQVLEDINLRINIPGDRINGTQFSPTEIENTRNVEQAIGRLKKYKLLTTQIPVAFLGTIEQVYTVCCRLCNFRYHFEKVGHQLRLDPM